MHTNTSIKQLLLWKKEVDEMARRRKPVPDSTVQAMAIAFSENPDVAAALNLAPFSATSEERFKAIAAYLRR